MASPENLASLDSWAFRATFPDSWFSDAIARDTETLTRALQKSLAGGNTDNYSASDTVSSFLDLIKPDSAPTSTLSGLSGSEPETPKPRKNGNPIPVTRGKVSKRKSRASKKSNTTFITADPANFRQMVQQVTGARIGNSQMQMAPILKPEPQRPGSRLQAAVGLPTLDTSAFLLDHHLQQQQQQQQVMVPASGPGNGVSGRALIPLAPPMVTADVGVGVGVSGGLDFDTLSTFPTLESWKVM